MKHKMTVALLSGGTSPEREVSLTSGNQVQAALDQKKYHVRRYDPKTDIPRLIAEASRIDVALVMLHGSPGEDGSVQGLLDLLGIPYQCAGVLGSAVSMNKLASKQLYVQNQIPTPDFNIFQKKKAVSGMDMEMDITACIERLGLPLVVKPGSGGSSIGMGIVQSADDLFPALENAFTYDDTVLAEAYVRGTEITGAVIGNRRLEALPIIEIVPKTSHAFFDYQAKYTAGETEEICPARISEKLAEKAGDLAKKAHQALFCKGYSRTDMIISGNSADADIYVLETNTIPGMTPASLLPIAARAAGMGFSDLIDRLIALALETPSFP